MELVKPLIIDVKCQQPEWKKAVAQIIEQGFSVEDRLDMTLQGVLMNFIGQVHDAKSCFHLNEVLNAFCEYANSKGYARIAGEPYKRLVVQYNRKFYTPHDFGKVIISKHDYNVRNDNFGYSCYLYDGEKKIQKFETPRDQRWNSSYSQTPMICRHEIDASIEEGYPYVVNSR